MVSNIDPEELSKIEEEFQKQLKQLLWSEISISSVMKELESKEPKIDLDIEYKQDCVFYMNRYWWSMPYPKEWVIGYIITSS